MSVSSEKWPKDKERKATQRNLIHEALMNLKSKNDSREARSHLGKHEDPAAHISGSFQAFMTKVSKQEVLFKERKEVFLNLEDVCRQEEQAFLKVRLDIEEMSRQCATEFHKREAIEIKLNQLGDLIHQLHSDCQIVTDGLHRILAERKAFEQSLMKDELVSFNCATEEMTTHYEQLIQVNSNKLLEITEKNSKLKEDSQLELEEIEISQGETESSVRDNISQQLLLLQNLEMMLAKEENLFENTVNHEESQSLHQSEVLSSLQKEIEVLEEDEALTNTKTADCDVKISELGTQLQLVQEELSVNNQSLQNIEEYNLSLQKRLQCHTEKIYEVTSQQRDLILEFDEITSQNKELSFEIEGSRMQLGAFEESTLNLISELTVELENVSSEASKHEDELQLCLGDAKLKSADLVKEENELSETLSEIKDDMQHVLESHNQVNISNSCLESKLADFEKDIEHLIGHKAKIQELLNSERDAAHQLERSLDQSEESGKEMISKNESTLSSLKENKKAVNVELVSISSLEQALLTEVQNVERDAVTFPRREEEEESKIASDYQVKISLLEREIKSLREEGFKSVQELKKKLECSMETRSQSEKNLEHVNVLNQDLSLELETYENILKVLKNELEVKEKGIQELAKNINEFVLELNCKSKQESEECSSVERYRMELHEADCEISELNLKIQEIQEDLISTQTQYEKERQVYLRDLVKFQQTCECRQDEIKTLQRQFMKMENLILEAQAEYKVVETSLSSIEKKISTSKKQVDDTAEELNDWRMKVKDNSQELKNTQLKASAIAQKVENLDRNIRIAKQRKIDRRRLASKAPLAPPQEEITPKFEFASTSKSNEITPRSILKKSKSTTPTQKKVSFQLPTKRVFDFDDSASSSSSINLEPEMAKRIMENPNVRYQIAAEMKEKRQAAKRMKFSVETENDAYVQPKQKIQHFTENEISSSTPEPVDKNNDLIL